MKARQLLQIINDNSSGHKRGTVIPLTRTSHTPYLDDFKKFVKYLRKITEKNNNPELNRDDINRLSACLTAHWKQVNNTPDNYEQSPDSYPNCVFIPVIKALISAKSISPVLGKTNCQHDAIVYCWVDAQAGSGGSATAHTTTTHVLAIPPKHVFFTDDDCVFDVRVLIQTMTTEGIYRPLLARDALYLLDDFYTFFQALTSVQQLIVCNAFVNHPQAEGIANAIFTGSRNALTAATTTEPTGDADKDKTTNTIDNEALLIMRRAALTLFATQCLQIIESHALAADKKQRLNASFNHFLTQHSSALYSGYDDCIALSDGHMVPMNAYTSTLTPKGIYHPQTKAFIYSTEQITEAFTLTPETLWPAIAQRLLTFKPDTLRIILGNVSPAAQKNVIQLMLSTMVSAQSTEPQANDAAAAATLTTTTTTAPAPSAPPQRFIHSPSGKTWLHTLLNQGPDAIQTWLNAAGNKACALALVFLAFIQEKNHAHYAAIYDCLQYDAAFTTTHPKAAADPQQTLASHYNALLKDKTLQPYFTRPEIRQTDYLPALRQTVILLFKAAGQSEITFEYSLDCRFAPLQAAAKKPASTMGSTAAGAASVAAISPHASAALTPTLSHSGTSTTAAQLNTFSIHTPLSEERLPVLQKNKTYNVALTQLGGQVAHLLLENNYFSVSPTQQTELLRTWVANAALHAIKQRCLAARPDGTQRPVDEYAHMLSIHKIRLNELIADTSAASTSLPIAEGSALWEQAAKGYHPRQACLHILGVKTLDYLSRPAETSSRDALATHLATLRGVNAVSTASNAGDTDAKPAHGVETMLRDAIGDDFNTANTETKAQVQAQEAIATTPL